jgi:hypothetical protein
LRCFKEGIGLNNILVLFAFFCYSFVSQILSATPPAITSIQVIKNTVEVNFTRYIDFNLVAQSDAEINQVVLVYGTSGRTCLSGEARQALDFKPNPSVVLNWNWDLIRSSSFPPGVEIWWRWEIRDARGNTMVTETSKVTIEDIHYSWQSLKNNSITLFWAEGDRSFGNFMMSQAQMSLDRLVKEAGLSLPNEIKIYVYPSADEIKSATLHMPDWIGGLAYPEHDTTLIGVNPQNASWANKIVPHELSHLVTGWRVFNCSGGEMPTWLSEGLARFAEGPSSEAEVAGLKKAVSAGNVPGLKGLTAGFAASTEISGHEYTYSGMVVTYLIEKFGAQKMDALLGRIKEGNQIDDALGAIYKLDTVELDRLWRTSVGLMPEPEVTFTPPTPTAQRTKVPTLALWTALAPTPANTATMPPTAVPTAKPSPETKVSTSISPTPLPATDSSAGIPIWGYAIGGVVIALLAAFLVLYFIKRWR